MMRDRLIILYDRRWMLCCVVLIMYELWLIVFMYGWSCLVYDVPSMLCYLKMYYVLYDVRCVVCYVLELVSYLLSSSCYYCLWDMMCYVLIHIDHVLCIICCVFVFVCDWVWIMCYVCVLAYKSRVMMYCIWLLCAMYYVWFIGDSLWLVMHVVWWIIEYVLIICIRYYGLAMM